jgi:2,3-bisphosphoglycerate-independent phosphoglycerate mutase
MHIGCGRRIVSDKVRINRALMDGSFFENEALLWAMEGVKRERKSLHLLGIVSFYSSHGSIDYLLALLELAKKRCVDKVYIHCLLGRRGERRKSGAMYVARIEERTSQLGIGKVVSIIGRHWALDREQHWDRVEKAYRLLIYGDGKRIKDRRE